MAADDDDGESHLDTDKLRILREGLGMTQEQAGAAAGFRSARQAWNHFESGRQSRITLATLWKLAAALKVEARELLKPGPLPANGTPGAKAPSAAKAKGMTKATATAKGKG